MATTYMQCSCGAVAVEVAGEAILQYDCQSVHGKAYSCSLYPAQSVAVLSGETAVFTLKTSPRTRCKQCGTFLFAEVPGRPVRGVNGELLPQGMFEPQFHIQCRYAPAPVQDHLPHYRDLPARFGGSDERSD